jgi:hypothetical protein
MFLGWYTYCDIITVHSVGSLKMGLFGSNKIAITNTIMISYSDFTTTVKTDKVPLEILVLY